MSRMSKEVEDDDQKIDPLSDCQDANNACPVPLVIPLLFMKYFLLYIDATTIVAVCEILIYIHHSAAGLYRVAWQAYVFPTMLSIVGLE